MCQLLPTVVCAKKIGWCVTHVMALLQLSSVCFWYSFVNGGFRHIINSGPPESYKSIKVPIHVGLIIYSTETILLRVYNILILAADKGHEVILILLDYSAAFDTINHISLFDRFAHKFRFKDTALSWIKSYFINHHNP